MDECWLDVSCSTRVHGSGEKIAQSIRNAIKEELGLTVSIGVSYNKIFAKLGSDMKKPDASGCTDCEGTEVTGLANSTQPFILSLILQRKYKSIPLF